MTRPTLTATELQGQRDRSVRGLRAAYRHAQPLRLPTRKPEAPVFVRNGATWTQEAYLKASNTEPGDNFGISVAISGDTIVVGAMGEGSASLGVNGNQTNNLAPVSGAAYVFVHNGTTWSQQAYLKASNTEPFDRFYHVAISGNRIVVGAFDEDSAVNGNQSDNSAGGAGAAYVFVRNGTTWTQEAYLKALIPDTGDHFGESVSISDDTVVVGAEHESSVAVGSGAAYVFTRSGSTWSQEQLLKASNAGPDDRFGFSVSNSGDTAIVGAWMEDSNATGVNGDETNNSAINSGAAYVFVRSGTTWSQQAYLKASDTAAGDRFGVSVAIEDDTAVVGADIASAAYVFTRSGTTWSSEATIPTPAGGEFGISVSVSECYAAVGVWNEASKGAAYAFDLAASEVYCTAGTSASGCQASISSLGCANATASSGFSLITVNVEGQKDGQFFFGTNGRQANPWGNGTSYQCVVPPVTRASLLSGSGTSGMCDGQLSEDLNALWCPSCPAPQKNPGAGALVQAQAWYRDPLSTSNQTTSLSDAIEFPVKP